ncbi:glutamine synthetase 1, mitochondrial-like [Contarinia nasturtii]|uniref:glutamine synthetase 1, mitochondrial-like n=1 Tax=Contarinia nasturtii TaxID=265458 RepID=UPI0012D43194|nr:glutamine synthetase 1, mitochondrial-like [Contarinia nasturtii]
MSMQRYVGIFLKNALTVQCSGVKSIDGTGENIRLKDRILNRAPDRIEDLPSWQYDGSSQYQALVCDTYKPDGSPTESNNRYLIQDAVDKTKQHEPWFGIEQEYTLLDIEERPFGWPKNGFPAPQGYCGVVANRVFARDLAEAHTLACLYAGIDFAGTNSEVMPAQWELL